MAQVAFERVSKVYPDGTRAVNDISLEIQDGEFMVLVGPSGCGKTTALRMVAGLEEISEGALRIGERIVNHVPSRDRDIAMVFQSYALYPHLSVYENIAFGLRLKKMPKAEIDERVHRAAGLLGLEEYLKRKPRALSGGQRQRVAMGRAIVRQPAAFLMDEPLSNLDAKLRVQTRAQIAELQRRLGVTTLYVTHDQVEAMTMGDRVAVLNDGKLQQVDTPRALFARPSNVFVAGFIGSPQMNLQTATLVEGGASMAGYTVALPPAVAAAAGDGAEVVVGFRPEALELSSNGDGLRVTVTVVEDLGTDAYVYGRLAGHADDAVVREADVVARLDPRQLPEKGARLRFRIRPDALHVFSASTGDRIL
jgi:multiple sugar transport system ATP-binding protein